MMMGAGKKPSFYTWQRQPRRVFVRTRTTLDRESLERLDEALSSLTKLVSLFGLRAEASVGGHLSAALPALYTP